MVGLRFAVWCLVNSVGFVCLWVLCIGFCGELLVVLVVMVGDCVCRCGVGGLLFRWWLV